jgi:O-antigen/teichoic acid export membrane protein
VARDATLSIRLARRAEKTSGAPTRLATSDPGRRFARAGILTVLFSVLTLGTNLVTGVVVARALGVAGRGELTAILTLTQMVGWAVGLGCSEAVSYHLARKWDDRGVVSAWVILVVLAGLLAVGAGELVLPSALHAQQPAAVHLGRLFLLTVVLTPLGLLELGILLGTHRYLFYNLVGFAQPAVTGLVYVVLWRSDGLTPGSALAATFVVSAAVGVVLARETLRGRLARPDWRKARPTVWYGLRAHGTRVGDMMNTRLDLLIIPAFLAASSVGLYSVATNVSWAAVSISAALAAIVLPAAASDPARGVVTVLRSLQATFAIGTALAIAIAVAADAALRLLYGSAFAQGALALRLLLPGAVCYACAAVLWAGLYALNRPLSAAGSQIVGLVVTVVGLALFLRGGGIVAAALVSTTSYAAVLVTAGVLYRRAANVGWREFVALPPTRTLASPARGTVSSG